MWFLQILCVYFHDHRGVCRAQVVFAPDANHADLARLIGAIAGPCGQVVIRKYRQVSLRQVKGSNRSIMLVDQFGKHDFMITGAVVIAFNRDAIDPVITGFHPKPDFLVKSDRAFIDR